MDEFSIRIEGLKELDAKLAQLATKAQSRVVRKALRDGGHVFVAAVAERAPERPDLPSGTALPPGALAADVQEQLGRSDEDLPAVIVAPGKDTAHVAMWVEYGHRIVKGGYSSKKRGKLQGSGRQIGDVPAHPFIRPAYEAVRQEAVNVTLKSLAEGIEKEAAKKQS